MVNKLSPSKKKSKNFLRIKSEVIRAATPTTDPGHRPISSLVSEGKDLAENCGDEGCFPLS